MKRILPLAIAVVILVGFVTGFSIHNVKAINADIGKLIYYNADTRNSCVETMDKLIDENSILLFGSSELSASDDVGYPPALYNSGNSDYNVIMAGRGYMQSLHHAISLGALSDKIENRKVVLILSPQWFVNWSVGGEAYASRFSERLYSRMVQNNKISYETKRKITDRVEELLQEGDRDEYERVLLYDKAYVEKEATFGELLQIKIWDTVMESKQKKDLLDEMSTLPYQSNNEKVISSEINYGELLRIAEEAGIEACTNNDWYIYDDYFTTYVKDSLESSKDSNTEGSYLESPEYDDLELFFKICEETGISPLIVSIPVNGLWYDWTGFPIENRHAYYQKIRDICREHKVSLLDFSAKEYEHYFLKDIMHLGWKGWVYLDEGVYRYYLSKDNKEPYPFNISVFVEQKDDRTEYRLDSYISDVTEADILADNETVHLEIDLDGYLKGYGKKQETIPKSLVIEADGVNGAGINCEAKTILNKIMPSEGDQKEND